MYCDTVVFHTFNCNVQTRLEISERFEKCFTFSIYVTTRAAHFHSRQVRNSTRKDRGSLPADIRFSVARDGFVGGVSILRDSSYSGLNVQIDIPRKFHV